MKAGLVVFSLQTAAALLSGTLAIAAAYADPPSQPSPPKLCVSPDDYGPWHTGSSDDAAAIQAAIDASRNGDASHGVARGTPICFLAGTYNTSRPLDFTGGPDGWKIYGAGMGGGTTIDSTFEESSPIMDFTGTLRLHLSDLAVRGSRGGATAAVLVGRATNGKGDEAYLDNVQLEMVNSSLTHPIAALINVCSDLMTAVHSKFNGPTGIVLSGKNIRKISTKSKGGFPAGGNGCNTLQRIRDSEVVSLQNEGILYSGGDALSVDGTYFAMEGTSTAAIRLVPDGGGGGDNLYLSDIRTESPSAADRTYVLDALAGSNGGRIEGIFEVKGGPYVHLPVGVAMAGYLFQMTVMDPHIPLVGGGGSPFNSFFISDQPVSADLGPLGASDTLIGVKPVK